MSQFRKPKTLSEVERSEIARMYAATGSDGRPVHQLSEIAAQFGISGGSCYDVARHMGCAARTMSRSDTNSPKSDTAGMLAVAYQSDCAEIPFLHDVNAKTLWGTQQQIAQVFGVDRVTVTQHLQNIWDEGEIDREATCKKFLQVQTEGGRQVSRQIEHYNLRAICAVGFRVKSPEAVRFRSWATDILEGEILGRTYKTAFAGQQLNEHLLAQLLSQAIDTQTTLAEGHNYLRLAVDNGFREVKSDVSEVKAQLECVQVGFDGRLANLESGRKPRQNPTPAVERQHAYCLDRKFHRLCPVCSDPDHPLLLAGGPLPGGLRWAKKDTEGVKYSKHHHHVDDVGKGNGLYDTIPVHQCCHALIHKCKPDYQPDIDRWLDRLRKLYPPSHQSQFRENGKFEL